MVPRDELQWGHRDRKPPTLLLMRGAGMAGGNRRYGVAGTSAIEGTPVEDAMQECADVGHKG